MYRDCLAPFRPLVPHGQPLAVAPKEVIVDRVWAHLQEIVLRLRNALKNGDWPLVQDEFDAVNKKMDKSKAQIEQTGIPKFYIKMLA